LGAILKIDEATLEMKGENYPYILMIKSSFLEKNHKYLSQAFSWGINLMR
jgi:hypothetical protein